jgi:hypothetical protein
VRWVCCIEWMNEYMNTWMNEWHECMNEWMNEWIMTNYYFAICIGYKEQALWGSFMFFGFGGPLEFWGSSTFGRSPHYKSGRSPYQLGPFPKSKKSLKEVVPYLTLPTFVKFEGPYKSGRYPFFLSCFLSFFFGYVGPSTFVSKVPQISSECGGNTSGMGVLGYRWRFRV